MHGDNDYDSDDNYNDNDNDWLLYVPPGDLAYAKIKVIDGIITLKITYTGEIDQLDLQCLIHWH